MKYMSSFSFLLLMSGAMVLSQETIMATDTSTVGTNAFAVPVKIPSRVPNMRSKALLQLAVDAINLASHAKDTAVHYAGCGYDYAQRGYSASAYGLGVASDFTTRATKQTTDVIGTGYGLVKDGFVFTGQTLSIARDRACKTYDYESRRILGTRNSAILKWDKIVPRKERVLIKGRPECFIEPFLIKKDAQVVELTSAEGIIFRIPAAVIGNGFMEEGIENQNFLEDAAANDVKISYRVLYFLLLLRRNMTQWSVCSADEAKLVGNILGDANVDYMASKYLATQDLWNILKAVDYLKIADQTYLRTLIYLAGLMMVRKMGNDSKAMYRSWINQVLADKKDYSVLQKDFLGVIEDALAVVGQ